MKHTSRLLLAAATLVAASSAHAATIIDDQFTDGGFTNGTDSLDTAWVNYNGGTLGVSTDATIGTGNALTYVAGGTFRGVAANFANTSLSIGESLNLSFDFHFVGTIANGNLRVALGNQVTPGTRAISDSGYFFAIGTGATTAKNFTRDGGTAGDMFSGADGTALTTSGTAFGVNNTNKHSLSFTATKTASGYDLEYSFDGGTAFTASDTSGSFINPFNGFVIGVTGNNNFNIDNVSVSAVPEPSTYGLMGAGALAAVAMVRRRRKHAGLAKVA